MGESVEPAFLQSDPAEHRLEVIAQKTTELETDGLSHTHTESPRISGFTLFESVNGLKVIALLVQSNPFSTSQSPTERSFHSISLNFTALSSM
jgi:hypothetical protein